MRSCTGLALAVALLVGLASCKSGSEPVAPTRPTPSYESVAESYNERVALLDRLWARAVVALRFTDAQGDRRYEQGDGHLQLRDAERLALSVGKLGEVLLWVGCDDERYWLFDRLADPTRLYLGRHDALGVERAREIGLPVAPRELLRLFGLRPLPDSGAIAWTDDGDLELTTADDRGAWRYILDPQSNLPRRIARLDAADRPLLDAELSDDKSVRITGRGFNPPRVAGRVRVTHVATGDSITIVLDGDVIDGRREGKPRAASFDLDVLRQALGPIGEEIDLDAPEPEAAEP